MPSTQQLETLYLYCSLVQEHTSNEEPEDIGIVLEDIKELQDVDNVPLAVAMLFRLMYSLNLSHAADLHYYLLG